MAPGADRVVPRNDALRPLLEDRRFYSVEETSIVFLDDVAVCPDDVLELIHQRRYQNADMTCAMDWTFFGKDATFHDVRIARDMRGETFFQIPESDEQPWSRAWDLFWISPWTKAAYQQLLAFQVYSCWNGAVVLRAKPVMEEQLRFRTPFEDECSEGEAKLLCKDLWLFGYNKIAVVPTVNLAYDTKSAEKIKRLKGYASQNVEKESLAMLPVEIQWRIDPPEIVNA